MQKTSLPNHPSPPGFFGVNFVRSKISPETFSKFSQICTRKTKFSRNFPISNDKKNCWKNKFTDLHLSWVFNLLNNEEIVLKRGKMYYLRQNYMTKELIKSSSPFAQTHNFCASRKTIPPDSPVCVFWCENCKLLETESVILIGGWSCLKLKQLNPPHKTIVYKCVARNHTLFSPSPLHNMKKPFVCIISLPF
jgi:hypothetical protein